MLSINDIFQARERIRPYVLETPLIRLPVLDEYLKCRVHIKAENMQITGAFKLRGAFNKALSLTRDQLDRGLVCASSGNHGRSLAYAARLLGAHATVVAPDTTPSIKIEAIRALGARVIQCPASQRFQLAQQVCDQQGGALVPPYNDETIMAGQGTLGLEIADQCPRARVVISPVSGGGLLGGLSLALHHALPGAKVYGAESALMPRYSVSLSKGERSQVPYHPTQADALVSQAPGELCFPVVQRYASGAAAASEEAMFRAMKLLLTQGKILAEPSSCVGMAAVLEGLIPVNRDEDVCFLITGGNVSLTQLARLEEVEI